VQDALRAALVAEQHVGVVVEYPQGYAITALKSKQDTKISNWRMDPTLSGLSNCVGDIGTHAENLA